MPEGNMADTVTLDAVKKSDERQIEYTVLKIHFKADQYIEITQKLIRRATKKHFKKGTWKS